MPETAYASEGSARSDVGDRGERYPTVLRVLHWLIVTLLIAQFAIAWTMPEIRRGTPPIGLVSWHLSVGLVILAVMLFRLGWRLMHAVPPAPTDLPRALQLLSRGTHYLLYTLLIVIPLLGWANASARGWPIRLFGAIPMPSLMPVGSDAGHAMGDVHATLATILLAVVALHVGGALYHLLVLKDRTVQRMI